MFACLAINSGYLHMLDWIKRIATPAREQLVENEKQIERLTGRLGAYNRTANELAGGFTPASSEQSVENQTQTLPPDQEHSTEEKVERLFDRLATPKGKPNALAGTFSQTYVIAVACQKGGSGKTTIAAHLAVQARGYNVTRFAGVNRFETAALIDERQTVTWREFNDHVNQLIGALRAAGLGVGDTVGVARVTARGLEFQFYGQALQAAVDGLGIAMGIRPYIDDDLAAGRLVAPFALSVPKGMRWYLVYRGFRTEQRDFAAFRRWIIRATAGPTRRKSNRHAG